MHVVRIWNSLPENIVSADRLSLFVRLLNRVNLSEFLIGKVRRSCALICSICIFLWFLFRSV